MNNFIEVHDLMGEPISININHICGYKAEGMGTYITTTSGTTYIAKESYKEIRCIIHDTTNSMISKF